MYSAGVTIAFTGAGLDAPASYLDNFRTVVDAGLSRDGALRALTITPAEILGVDDVLGSLDVGKAANVVAIEGDIFDEDARVAAVWVDGTRYDATTPMRTTRTMKTTTPTRVRPMNRVAAPNSNAARPTARSAARSP